VLSQQLAEAIAAAPLSNLDDLSRDVWRAMAAGMLTDNDAEHLAEVIHARRAIARTLEVSQRATEPRTGPSRPWSYFPPPRPPQGPQRRSRSIARRRQLAASGPMPPALACRFTQGELAVLRIVSDEVKRTGSCARTVAEIAARAGVCLSTVRNAVRAASRLGLLTVEERRQHCRPNLPNVIPNVIRVISAEWLAWLARGGGCKKVNATDKEVLNREKRGGFNSSRKPESGVRFAHTTQKILRGGRRGP
jgi:hypothetical protein